MGWAKFWAIFSQTRLVTLIADLNESRIQDQRTVFVRNCFAEFKEKKPFCLSFFLSFFLLFHEVILWEKDRVGPAS
jgi:hypothetical protein